MFVSLHNRLKGPSGDVSTLDRVALCLNSFLKTQQMLMYDIKMFYILCTKDIFSCPGAQHIASRKSQTIDPSISSCCSTHDRLLNCKLDGLS